MPVGPAGTLQTLANYLTAGYWEDTGRTSRAFDYSNNNGQLYYNVAGSEFTPGGLTPERQVLVREAFKIYEEVLGIDFIETPDVGNYEFGTEVDFFFGDNSSGASHTGYMYSGTGGEIDYAVINVDLNWQGGESTIGGYTFQTFMHEIGHGLGLGHQGYYNSSANYSVDAIWANDSWQQSIMSYFDQAENTSTFENYARLVSPMHVDFLALDDLYGSWEQWDSFAGDTIWGFNTTITEDVSAIYANLAQYADENAFCIVDDGGIDTLDFSGYSAAQAIRLAPASAASTVGSVSSIGGLIGNMVLAVGTVIERAIGGSGNDTLIGNSVANILTAGAGNDTCIGSHGNDTIRGDAGHDTLRGGNGKDYLEGGLGRDIFDYDAAAQSGIGVAKYDEIRPGAAVGSLAFDGAGAAAGDRIDLLGLGNLNWGGRDKGSIWLGNVGTITHCYVTTDTDTTAEMDIAIRDGSVLASKYTAADFLFL